MLGQISQSRGGGHIGVAGGEASADDARAVHAASAALISHHRDGFVGLQHATVVIVREEERPSRARRSSDDRVVIQRESHPDATAELQQLLHERFNDGRHHHVVRVAALRRAISQLTQAALVAEDEA